MMSLKPVALAVGYPLAAEPAEVVMYPRYLENGLARFRQVFVVLAQPAIAPQPRQGPLHDPTASQRLKTSFTDRTTHDPNLIAPVMHAQPAIQFIVVILVIRLHYFQSWKVRPRHLREDLLGRPGI